MNNKRHSEKIIIELPAYLLVNVGAKNKTRGILDMFDRTKTKRGDNVK